MGTFATLSIQIWYLPIRVCFSPKSGTFCIICIDQTLAQRSQNWGLIFVLICFPHIFSLVFVFTFFFPHKRAIVKWILYIFCRPQPFKSILLMNERLLFERSSSNGRFWVHFSKTPCRFKLNKLFLVTLSILFSRMVT